MKKYEGVATGGGVGGQTVLVDGKPLKHIVKHSPTGLNWGYGGSGPADLALSILTDLYDPEFAEANYQQFKWDIIAKLPQKENWILTEELIVAWQRQLSAR